MKMRIKSIDRLMAALTPFYCDAAQSATYYPLQKDSEGWYTCSLAVNTPSDDYQVVFIHIPAWGKHKARRVMDFWKNTTSTHYDITTWSNDDIMGFLERMFPAMA